MGTEYSSSESDFSDTLVGAGMPLPPHKTFQTCPEEVH